jgi:hypothetical protein
MADEQTSLSNGQLVVNPSCSTLFHLLNGLRRSVEYISVLKLGQAPRMTEHPISPEHNGQDLSRVARMALEILGAVDSSATYQIGHLFGRSSSKRLFHHDDDLNDLES